MLVPVLAGWWVVATGIGLWLGRGGRVNAQIARLLAQARQATSLPEQRPGFVLLNRLWPLLVYTIVAGAFAFVIPQVPGVACGGAIVWALAWRHQEKAVEAIEDRDGSAFYIEHTSPFKPIRLIRTPGFRRETLPAGPA